jgi:PAS domain S-box-containing protein
MPTPLDADALLTTILQGIGQPFYAVDRDWRITHYNDHAARHFGKPAAEMIGRRIWDVFPQEPDAKRGRILHAAMEGRTATEGETWSMVGRWVAYRTFPIGDGMGVVFRDITDRKRAESERDLAEATLRKRSTELETVLETMPTAVLFTSDGKNVVANRRAMDLLRLENRTLTGARPFRLFRNDKELADEEMPMARALRGETLDDEVHVIEFAGGERRTMLWRAKPLRSADQAIRGAVCAAADVTERHRYEDHLKLLLNELNHRVKNTLTMVQSIANQTLRQSDATAGAAFEQRLMTLSAVHSLLTDASWAGARLHDIVRASLRAHLAEEDLRRLSFDGEDMRLQPKTAVALSIALHELGTNALKYGALSVERGSVAVRWTTEHDRFRLRWEESGGPRVAPPAQKGFGSRMIEEGLSHELQGAARIDYLPGGLVCTIDAPLDAIRDAQPTP